MVVCLRTPAPDDGFLQSRAPSLEPSLERLVRRMKCASKRTVLNRLEETWETELDQAQQADVALEKSLWISAALERRLDRYPRESVAMSVVSNRMPTPKRRTLELACNRGKCLTHSGPNDPCSSGYPVSKSITTATLTPQ